MQQHAQALDLTAPRHASGPLSRLAVVVCLCVAAGCAKKPVKAIAELPPLDMPAAPPRVVEVTEPQQPPVVALPEEPRTTVRPRPATPTQRADAPRNPEPPKTDVIVTETPKPAVDDPPKTPPTTLRTTPTQREAEVERRVNSLIAQAMNDLNRINYQALSSDARNQYDTAKRFANQAQDALRARNLVFANNLADKAAALAAQLLGR